MMKRKQKYLSIEIQQMWNMKYMIPVTIGANGIVTKQLKKYNNTRKAVNRFSTNKQLY
jgi:hypothetical protein